MGYILAFIGGMLVGIVSSCILLAQKNLQKAQQIEKQIGVNFNTAKAAYKAYVDDNGAESRASENDLGKEE